MEDCGSLEHSSLLFIARFEVPTKALELRRSKIQLTKTHHAENKEIQHRSGHFVGICCSVG